MEASNSNCSARTSPRNRPAACGRTCPGLRKSSKAAVATANGGRPAQNSGSATNGESKKGGPIQASPDGPPYPVLGGSTQPSGARIIFVNHKVQYLRHWGWVAPAMVARSEGLEPPAFGFEARRSIQLS